MSAPLRQFIVDRRTVLLAQKAEIDAELLELEMAEAVLPVPHAEVSARKETIADLIKRQRLGIKRLALSALYKGPEQGLTAMEILTSIEADDGTRIARTSLSPQLSRMKDDGLVSSDGNTWRLTDKGRLSMSVPV